MLRPLLISLLLATAAPAAVLAAEPAAKPTGAPSVADAKATPAPAGTYVSDAAHTTVLWSLDHSGLSRWTARFVGAEAKLDWRPEDPTSSTLTVAIDPKDLRTDFPHPEEVDFDDMIATSPDFLAGQPITFVSTAIERTGATTGRVEGALSLRGETHPAVLEVTFNGSMADHPFSHEPKLGFSASARFKRSDWGMGILVPFLGDEITVTIETQMAPPAS